MEVAGGEGKMKFLGTADLEMRNLKQLFEWATVSISLSCMAVIVTILVVKFMKLSSMN